MRQPAETVVRPATLDADRRLLRQRWPLPKRMSLSANRIPIGRDMRSKHAPGATAQIALPVHSVLLKHWTRSPA